MSMESADFPFLTTVLLSCVAGLLVILFIPEDRKAQIKWVAAVFSGITLILSVYLFFVYDKSRGGLQFVERYLWVESLGITYFNAADGFNLPMLLLTGIVFFTGVLTMWELEYRVKEFYALYFLLVAGVFGLFMSMDLFFIFVWYDVSLFPMYLLIAVWGTTRKEYGAMKLTLYLLAGSAMILPAIVYLFVKSGLHTFDVAILMRPGTFSVFEQKFAFIFLYLGFGILAAVWPFHTWSPVGHVAAPHSVSMVHAGVLMIGYSSVSHMGIVGLGLATVTVDGLNGAVFQMFAHGVMTALFFSSVGYIYDRTHTKIIGELGGLSRIMPVASGYFIIAAMASMGIPCLASFWGELVVFISAFKTYPFRGVLAVCALVVSALFMLRVVQKTFYGPLNEHYADLPDVPFSLGLPRMILVAVLVFFGLFPSLMFDMIETASIPFFNGLP
jgi:NADH-quinone oxidoreductase subunit M